MHVKKERRWGVRKAPIIESNKKRKVALMVSVW